MKVRTAKGIVLFVTLGVAAGLMFVPLSGHWRGIWQTKIFDLGHVPLFAGLTWGLWLFFGPRLIWPVLIALTAAGLGEIFQDFVGRTGSLLDFIRGALGTLAAAAGIQAWLVRINRRMVVGYLLLMIGILAWPVFDAAPTLLDAYEGALAFPILAEFRTHRELLRWRCQQAELTRVADSERSGVSYGRLKFFPGPLLYCYGAIRPIRRDFSEYRSICCSFSVEEEPLDLYLSIRSGPGEEEETNLFQLGRTYSSGKHILRLDLNDVAKKARPRPLDLTYVWIVQFFVINPQKTRTIRVHRIWLEK